MHADDVIEVLTAIVDAIARGDFMIAPWNESKACAYCDFKPICPRGPGAYMERRGADPRLSTFVERIRGVQ